MFSGIRIRLTLLYLGAALGLIFLMGAGSYLLLRNYFQRSTDLALSYRMVIELRRAGVDVPEELRHAEREWLAQQPPQPSPSDEHEDDEDDDDHRQPAVAPTAVVPVSAELAPIVVLRLTADGIPQGDDAAIDIEPDRAAAAAAQATGADWRTVVQSDGTTARLYTRSVKLDGGVVALQLGRRLDDQRQVLASLLTGLVALGAASAAGMGLGSWWLAGRSLLPAQQAWEQQRIFVANASHELRAPLTLLRASGEMLQRTLPADDTDRRELVADVLAECDHLSALVTDLLLLSRLDAGQIQFASEMIKLDEIFADVQRQVGRVAAERGVTIGSNAGGRTVRADRLRLRQVLLILLDNALRYTPPGGAIELAARSEGGRVLLEVRDSGSGIPTEHLDRVFERFYRVDSSRSTATGSGLGLAIARSLVEGQHGRITLDSRPGHGTTARISLPETGRA